MLVIPGDFNVTSTSVCTGLASFFQALFARIMAGMHEEDSYAVFSGDDSDPVSSGKYSGTFVFTAPVAVPTVMSFTVPLNGCTIDATVSVVASYSRRRVLCCGGICVEMSYGGCYSWWCLRFCMGQCFVAAATVVTSSSSSASVPWECLRRDVVWWWMFHSWLLTILFGHYLFPVPEDAGFFCVLNAWFSSNDTIYAVNSSTSSSSCRPVSQCEVGVVSVRLQSI